MFLYTRATLDKIVSDLKRSVDISNILGQLIYVLYLIYAIFAPVGFVYLNVFLLTVSLAYFVIYIVYYNKNDKASKEVKNTAKHTFKWIKLSSKALTLGITLYGVYSMTNHLTAFSIILTTLTIIAWILNLAIEIVTIAVERYAAILKEAFTADVNDIMKPVQVVNNTVKKIVGLTVPDMGTSSTPGKALKKIKDKFAEKKLRVLQKKREAALAAQKEKEAAVIAEKHERELKRLKEKKEKEESSLAKKHEKKLEKLMRSFNRSTLQNTSEKNETANK